MTSQLPPGQPYHRTLYGVGVTGSDVDVSAEPMRAGGLLAVHSLVALDADSGATRVEVLRGAYGAQHVVAVSGALSAGVPLLLTQDFYVSDGQVLTVRFIGSTTGDALSVEVDGEVRYAGGPATPVAVEE
jgi:hypothetical protein